MLLRTKYLEDTFSYVNERDTLSLECKHKGKLLKTELHLTNLVSCTISYIANSTVLTAESMFQSYHSLVPSINSFFIETV